MTRRGAPRGSIDAGVAKVVVPQGSAKTVRESIKDGKEEDKAETSEQLKIRKRAENMKKRREEFLDKGIMMALYGTVEQKVKCACMSTDHLLVQKRTRLRELLLSEDVAYMTEYVAKCQQANANREEELRKRAFELKSRSERERKRFVDQKLLEHVVETCDAARPVLAQRHLMEVKKDQLWQIKEKYALQEARREEDKMYHDLMIKNMLALKENEEENAKLAWIKQRDAKSGFLEQIKLKEQKREEEKQMKENEMAQLAEEMRLLKEEAEKEQTERRKKKEEMKTEFDELLAREREIKERRKREEEEIDKTFTKLLKIEEEKEKRKESSNKERLKREMDIFLESTRELKRLKEEEERRFNETLDELNAKKCRQKDEDRKRLRAAREELFSSVLRGREEQIKEKRESERRAEEQRKTEIKLLELQLEQQNKIREDYERRCAEKREEYRNQLLRQIQEAEDAKRKKKEEEEEYERSKKAEEEKEIQTVKELLKTLPVKGKDHPMKTIAMTQPPRYMCPHPCPR